MGNKQKKIWVAVALVVILAGLVYYFAFYKKNHKAALPVAPKKVLSTFSNKPYAQFPLELMPRQSLTPQYFDNSKNTGGIFLIKSPLSQAEAAFETGLENTSWQITNKFPGSARIVLFISKKTTSQTGQVVFEAMPNNSTSLAIGITK